MSLARAIADFIVRLDLDNLPPEIVEKGRACVLNGYGIGLGCHNTPYAPVARAAALAMDGEQTAGATLLGDGRKTSVAGATLANGALFHGRAQEDACGAAHLGAVMIPLLTALTEARGIPLERFLPALIAGYEAGGLLELNFAGKTTPAGLRASTLYGTVAAAAAAAKLLGLDAERTAAALSNAASFAGGLLQSFADGSDEWRYQVGMVARTGLVAAELARAGSVSAPFAFEGPSGFVKAFAREECDADALAGQLGKEWATLRVAFKPYPVCAFNQTPVTAAIGLRDNLNGGAIEAVRVRMNPYETGYAGMDSKGPFHSISGTLMSIPFCIASTLVHGVPTMAAMTAYDDAEVNALIDRTDLISDQSVATLCCTIEIDIADGGCLVKEQNMTFADYSFDQPQVSALIRRIGDESQVPSSAYDRLEDFAERLPDGDIGQVLAAFAELQHLPAA
jgi:2-methylcitrate dehydratase PrpD